MDRGRAAPAVPVCSRCRCSRYGFALAASGEVITAQTIVPAHNLLAGTLARHCGLAEPDADIHQLAFATVAMAHDNCMSREFMKMLAPDLLDRPRAMERILDRLVGYSRALVDYEIERRRANAKTERSSR